MTDQTADWDADQRHGQALSPRFTPAEWRHLLEGAAFLTQGDNSYRPPRRFMGIPVRIVPDHGCG